MLVFMDLYIMLHDSVNGIEDAGTETETNLFHELYYHFLGTDQSEDVLCWRDSKHAQWFSRAEVTDDGQVIGLETALHTSSCSTLQYVLVICSVNQLNNGRLLFLLLLQYS